MIRHAAALAAHDAVAKRSGSVQTIARFHAAMKALALVPPLMLSLAACAPASHPASRQTPTEHSDDLARARVGEAVVVGGPKVTALTVLEDSRCPEAVRCVWAGRVRVTVRIDLGSGSHVRELTQGKPIPVADGTLELVEVQPGHPEGAIAASAYRFGFRFRGGL